MLEPRNAIQGKTHTGNTRSYGVCPWASQVRACGPKSVSFNGLPYKRLDAQNFFSHLAFEIGEPHNTPGVKDLIEAVYRHVGLAPDPPDEFKGFYSEPQEDGFAVIEISVKDDDSGPKRPKVRNPYLTNKIFTTTAFDDDDEPYKTSQDLGPGPLLA
jgi:hypothetical protein